MKREIFSLLSPETQHTSRNQAWPGDFHQLRDCTRAEMTRREAWALSCAASGPTSSERPRFSPGLLSQKRREGAGGPGSPAASSSASRGRMGFLLAVLLPSFKLYFHQLT